MNMEFNEMMVRVGIMYVPFLFAICFHEYAHGWVAKRLGDPTAELMGRVSMNPLVHMDFLGTVVFPLMAIVGGSPLFFGWAKPVPVITRNLKNPRTDLFWVALAGPASNFLLACVGFIIMGFRHSFPLQPEIQQLFGQALYVFVMFNLFLMIFNLIPVHPLDGGKILARFLPPKANLWLEKNSSTITMVLFGVLILDGLTGHRLKLISGPVEAVYSFLGAFFSLVLGFS